MSAPFTLVAELTHRCALACPYCSNPRALVRDEIDTGAWTRTIDEAAALGVAQIALTGGEPLARRDLEELVARARARELYVNLITSGVPLDRARLAALVEAGVDHVQLSLQDGDEATADRIAGFAAHAHKRALARAIVEAGVSLTINVVLHRENVARAGEVVAFAEEVGADRVELANAQYLGWALENRALLLPTEAQIAHARRVAEEARARGRLEVAFVVPDYFSSHPRACMDGWGRRFVVVAPDGAVLPCHAARSIPGLVVERVGDRPLAEIWADGGAFQAFRGEAWLPDECRGCARRDVDFGGCRCQAFALTGDARAADPACVRSRHHDVIARAHAEAEAVDERRYLHRGR